MSLHALGLGLSFCQLACRDLDLIFTRFSLFNKAVRRAMENCCWNELDVPFPKSVISAHTSVSWALCLWVALIRSYDDWIYRVKH